VPVDSVCSCVCDDMLLCMHSIAAREVLALVTAITLLINCSYSFHEECLELFSQQLEIGLQAHERTAVLPFRNNH